jgi:hypothetical protein
MGANESVCLDCSSDANEERLQRRLVEVKAFGQVAGPGEIANLCGRDVRGYVHITHPFFPCDSRSPMRRYLTHLGLPGSARCARR